MSVQKKVIIVEDELDFAETVKVRLEISGYYADIASNAYSGVHEGHFMCCGKQQEIIFGHQC